MIHSDNPYVDAPEHRDPVRQFRGRLAAPVTVVCSGPPERRVGLTVSSLFLVEAEPPLIYLVVAPTTDLWEATDSGRFVVHTCRFEHHQIADTFAGLRPSPGGMFVAVDVADSEWGPTLSDLPNRAYCTTLSQTETGYTGLIIARIDHIELEDLTTPLIHFRGRYHTLS